MFQTKLSLVSKKRKQSQSFNQLIVLTDSIYGPISIILKYFECKEMIITFGVVSKTFNDWCYKLLEDGRFLLREHQFREFYPKKGRVFFLRKGCITTSKYHLFFWSCKYGYFECVEEFLKDKSFKPHINHNHGLVTAITHRKDAIIKLLIADNRVNPLRYNQLPLEMAVRNNYFDLAKLLIQGTSLELGFSHRSFVTMACARGDVPQVIFYLENKFDLSFDNNRAIGGASGNGHLEVVKMLLEDDRVDPSANDNYAFRRASKNGHLEIVKLLLLDKRVDPSAQDNYAIKYASGNGHLEIIKLLLTDKRVDPSVDENHAITMATKNGYLDIIMLLLLDKRVDPSAQDNWAIGWASKNGHMEIVELLLSDVRVDPSDDNNYAIRQASENGHMGIVELLMSDVRVDPSVCNNYAIRHASQNGRWGVVKLLLQDERVDPSTDGNWAIRYASENGHLEVVKLLLQDKRVDPSDENRFAIRRASKNGHVKVVRLLREDTRVPQQKTKNVITNYFG